MFIFGIILIISSLVYLLITNNERRALYIFTIPSIIYLIFSYGVPLNDISLIYKQSDLINNIIKILIIFTTLYTINKFEKTIFLEDYNLMLRSFFFRYETIIIALFLVGILISSGVLIIDFLVLITIVRLINIDKLISYLVVTSVLFVNALFVYPLTSIRNLQLDVEYTQFANDTNIIVVVVLVALMSILYFTAYLYRRTEKSIKLDIKSIGIIILTGLVGLLAYTNFSSEQLLIYLPIVALALLYLNDMNLRKKFSRLSNVPITYSIGLFAIFLFSIYISLYSVFLFLILIVILQVIVSNKKYKQTKNIFDLPTIDNKTIVHAILLIITMILIANHSEYNATIVGVPYVQYAIENTIAGNINTLERTYSLYTNAAFFSNYTITLINPSFGVETIKYLLISIPALSIISIPIQILLITATGYKTKMSGEVLIGVIGVGLITITLISYLIGV